MICTDEIGFGGLRLLQDDEAYRYGVDSVILADFARCCPGDSIADLGTDTGVIPLIINAKYSPASLCGIELREDAAELARRNAELNGISGKFSVVCADVKDVKTLFRPGSFSAVCSNPPYFEGGRGLVCANPARQTARTETTAGLADFMDAAAWLLPKGGSLYMVYRPSRLADLMSEGRRTSLEPKELRMVVPHAGEAANMVLVRFIKGAGRELKIFPELAVRKPDGSYTDEMKRIYGK